MNKKSFQEYYAPEFSHCFGCGTANEQGLHVKSYWVDGTENESVAYYRPEGHHTGGFPGFVYGGLIAAILDCHGNGTAAAAGYKREMRAMDTLPALRYVTANLNLNYKKPTPMGVDLELRARVVETTARKVSMELRLIANGTITVEGSMISVLLPA
ncbi:thioesterase [Porphyromonas sp. COT-108 OH2963]|uniref:PaaI family thioesterase n=1 Tax=Porphyromonas sp. COT-108 OH2963 TaxID=1515614 RepID=UPI00052C09AC|nr:PaaI family thioesterase [Porphyromonas sp. COT-108 OH2963]KGN95220.1 thioesterase [Porphyromonas sp. COT-108 OH2963]